MRAFVAVARRGTFTFAATELNLTQSAVSALVRDLEEQLGLAAFDRTTRQVSLTEAGSHLLQLADRILRDLNSAVIKARGLDLTGFVDTSWLVLQAFTMANKSVRYTPEFSAADGGSGALGAQPGVPSRDAGKRDSPIRGETLDELEKLGRETVRSRSPFTIITGKRPINHWLPAGGVCGSTCSAMESLRGGFCPTRSAPTLQP